MREFFVRASKEITTKLINVDGVVIELEAGGVFTDVESERCRSYVSRLDKCAEMLKTLNFKDPNSAGIFIEIVKKDCSGQDTFIANLETILTEVKKKAGGSAEATGKKEVIKVGDFLLREQEPDKQAPDYGLSVKIKAGFAHKSDQDETIGQAELQELLNDDVEIKEAIEAKKFDGFDKTMCSLAIGYRERSEGGKRRLTMKQFANILTFLKGVMGAYTNFDVDGSGTLDPYELREVLEKIGSGISYNTYLTLQNIVGGGAGDGKKMQEVNLKGFIICNLLLARLRQFLDRKKDIKGIQEDFWLRRQYEAAAMDEAKFKDQGSKIIRVFKTFRSMRPTECVDKVQNVSYELDLQLSTSLATNSPDGSKETALTKETEIMPERDEKYPLQACNLDSNDPLTQSPKPTTLTFVKKSWKWFNVDEVAENFIGREQEIEALDKLIMESHSHGSSILNIVGIAGMAGVGKSMLARKYAFRFKEVFDGNVIWINCENRESMRRSFEGLGNSTGLHLDDTLRDEDLVNAVYDKINTKCCLLVFDGIEDKQLFQTFRPRIEHPSHFTSYVLITSFRSDLTPAWQNIIHLDAFTLDEAVQFIQGYLSSASRSKAEELAEQLGRLPLALQQALAYIREYTDNNDEHITAYLVELATNARGVLRSKCSNSIPSTFEAIHAMLSQVQQGSAIKLLNVISYLNPCEFSVKLLTKLFGNDTRRFLRLLEMFSVVRILDQTVTIHCLVQKVNRLNLSPSTELETVHLVMSTLAMQLNDNRQTDLNSECSLHASHLKHLDQRKFEGIMAEEYHGLLKYCVDTRGSSATSTGQVTYSALELPPYDRRTVSRRDMLRIRTLVLHDGPALNRWGLVKDDLVTAVDNLCIDQRLKEHDFAGAVLATLENWKARAPSRATLSNFVSSLRTFVRELTDFADKIELEFS